MLFARSLRRGRFTTAIRAAALVGVSLGFLGTATTQSQAQSATSLTPADRDELAGEERGFWTLNKLAPQQYMREMYWQFPKDTPAFFRDSMLQFVARTYYLTRDNFDGSKSQAWTAGGWVAFRSGLIGNMFGVHAAAYTSQPLFAPGDEGGSKLLTPDQNALNSLGQLYGRMQISDQEVRAGRMLVDTPLINPADNRMVPNTFEGAMMVTLPDKDRDYDYAVGYLSQFKARDSNSFISMSDGLTNPASPNRGAPFGMVKYRPMPGLSTAFMDYYVQDFVNTGFAQAEYDFRRPKDVPNWILGANIIDQRSVGADLINGNSFQTYQASGKAQAVYAGWTLFAAGSVTGEGSKIFSPFGTKPNYTDMQQTSFDNAGEKAIGGSIAYDFTSVGLNGLSTGAWYTQGWGAIDGLSGIPIPNRNELDLWIQYRPTEGPFKGLRIKTQYANVRQDGNVNSNQPEFRFIVDYTILFRPPIN
jgi:hypothetical protein